MRYFNLWPFSFIFHNGRKKKVSHIPLEPGDTIGGETCCVAWEKPSKIRTIGFRVFRVFPQIYPNIMANLTNNRYNVYIYIYNMGILNGYYYRLIMVNSYHGQLARYPATK